jgi:HEAT repeat protein
LIGSKTAAIVTAVAGTLNDSDAETRRQACLVLAKMGVLTRRVELRVVEAMTKDTDREVRAHAVRTLTSAYGAEAASTIALLTQRLKDDPDFEVRVAIAEELGSLGNSGKAAIPALRQAMKDPQTKVRDAATAAIRQIERPPPKPMP